MSLNINPEIEASLRALAQLSGLSVEGFLKQMIDERSGLQSPSRRNPDEWAAEFDRLADSFPSDNCDPESGIRARNLYLSRW